MIGQIVKGQYQIEALVGRGGMGVVYRALDLAKNEPVALKMMHRYLDMDTETALTRFHREFRVLAQLDHPHIVRAYDQGAHQGVPYLVLEWLPGRPLTDEINQEPLERDRLLLLARQICQALHYIHAQSIVHRDLKPGNLMLLSPEETPQIKLMDFGLVRQTNLSLQLTQEGAALGTVAYMAPEQAQGLPVDFRADLYALGIILYEMATGRLPFVHDNPAMLLMHQLSSAPPSPRQFNPAVDEGLEALILELMAKEPAQRPANAEQLLARLAELADEKVPALGPLGSLARRADLIPRVPLIGRETARQRLTDHWTAAQHNQGRVVLLSGVAGAGKTRLLTEVSLPVRLGRQRFLRSYCREQTALPYQPVLDLLDPLVQELPVDIRQSLPLSLSRLLPGEQPASPNGSDDPASVNQAEARLRLFAACWEVLQQSAKQQPLLLAIEDLQGADPASLELLSYLIQRVSQAPILLALTYRPEEVESNPEGALAGFLRDLARHPAGHSLELPLLTRDQVEQFLGSALGWKETPSWLVDRFHWATGGNPLFIEETLKALAVEGQVARWTQQNTSQWLTQSSLTLPLPQNVLDLAERRLSLLSAEDRPILTSAAVLGSEFTFGLLQAITDLDEDSLLDAIDRLLAARLIEELPFKDGDDRYRFGQEALRQALLNTISRRRLRRLHQRTGETMQQLYDTGQARHWPALAYHFAAGGDQERGLKYSSRAGDAAARVYAHAEAIAHYSQALEMGRSLLEQGRSPDPAQLVHLYTRRGRSLELVGRFQEALENYQEMEQLGRSRSLIALELAGLLAQATICSTPTAVQDLNEGRALSQKALALARQAGAQEAEAKALWNLVLVYMNRDQPRQALSYGEQSLAIARELNLPEQLAYTLNDLSNAYLAVGQPDRAQAMLAEAGRLWRQLDNKPMLADNLFHTAVNIFLAGQYRQAESICEETLRLNRSINNRWGEANISNILSQIYIEYGELAKALALIDNLTEIEEQLGPMPPQVTIWADLARIYGSVGLIEEALRLGRKALERAEALVSTWRPYAMTVLAQLYLQQGDLEAAEAAVAESYEGLNIEEPSSFAVIWVSLTRAELALTKAEYNRVIEIIDQFLAQMEQLQVYPYRADGYYLKAQALLVQGDFDAAGQALEQGRTIAERLGSRRSLWRLLALSAQFEAEHGLPEAAADFWRQAQAIIDYIAAHAPPDLRRAFLALPQVQAVQAA